MARMRLLKHLLGSLTTPPTEGQGLVFSGGRYIPGAGGGSSKHAIYGNYDLVVPLQPEDPLTWLDFGVTENNVVNDDLLDLTDPMRPTIKTDGTYAVTYEARIYEPAEGVFESLLRIYTSSPDIKLFASIDLASPLTPLQGSVTWFLTAGTELTLQTTSNDAPGETQKVDFTVRLAKLS